VLVQIVRSAAQLRVKTLTVYSFSTENWERPGQEIDALMNIFELYLIKKREWMVCEGVRLDAIGDLSRLPLRVRKAFEETKMMTKNGDRINLVLALNYGARDEIRRAVVKILQKNAEKKIEAEEITEEFIGENLDTKAWGDPDLLIRTSGEFRLSNFLLWQISYTELYMTDTLWPDFSSQNFYEAVLSFQQRYRRRGGGV
jgi:undecaprenyl diphosphate synthase